ncbi:MAG: serine hydrolase [Fluviicola sp.]|nr:serine hydrolase [Fluviicola sp.]
MKKSYMIGTTWMFTVLLNTTQAQISTALSDKLDATLDSMKTVLGAKSLSAAIQTADESTWAHAIGTSSVFASVTPDDTYLIGSVTKTITSACVLQLADEGVLHLDDSLYEWLPAMPYIDTTITIRQLLNHTSGIYDVLSHPHNQDSLLADVSRIWTPEELIDRFISPAIFAPGTSWSYSNTNYFLLSMIIKEATGNPYYTELRNRFYTPLQLNSFFIPSYENVSGPVAHLWLDITGDGVLDDAHNFYMNYLSLNSTAGAAGGYFATPTDCTKWMRTYMRGDLLSDTMMAQAQTVVNAPGSQGGKYGLGLMKNQSNFLGYLAYGHGGDLAYHASSWYFPALDQSITVFTNDNNKNSWTLLPVVRELLRTIIDDQTADLEEVVAPEMRVSPNPFTDHISIEIKETNIGQTIEMHLVNSLGQQIASQTIEIEKEQTLAQWNHLETLPGGVYFVQLRGENGWTKTIKMVK